MILPKPEDAIHKLWLYRILTEIADNYLLTKTLRFKGGTCAAMREIIERFSIDLDFDLLDQGLVREVRKNLEIIFKKHNLVIKDQSQNVPRYFLKYPNQEGRRNTIKIDITFPAPQSNEYESIRLIEIDRIIYCQTPETMFANKLVAIIDRFQKRGAIAGRDIFDIHTFFSKGFLYKSEVIEERVGKKCSDFLKDLKKFIEKRINQTIIDQDLNSLLSADKFKKVRKSLKQEVLMFLG